MLEGRKDETNEYGEEGEGEVRKKGGVIEKFINFLLNEGKWVTYYLLN